MAEQSFPKIESPLTDDQWKSVTLAQGDGIIDEGGNPYALELSNTNDRGTIKIDTITGYNHAILRGFYHKMDTSQTVNLPAVTATRTYYVALRYDPTAADPIKLGVWTSLDETNGKYYLLLNTVTRQPNQLLTNATVTRYAPKVIPTIQVDRESDLPASNRVLWGTQARCWRENKLLRASWGGWKPVSGYRSGVFAMNGWSASYATEGIIAQPAAGGWDCSLVGNVTRTAETYSITDWSIVGTLIPAELRPSTPQYMVGIYRNSIIGVSLNANGQILIRPVTGSSLTITSGFAFTFNFSWFTAVSPSSMT